MKRLYSVFLLAILAVILVGCDQNILPIEVTDKTNFEELMEFVSTFDIDVDKNAVKNNLLLTKRTEHELMTITWKSSKPDVINSDGIVTRPANDQEAVEVRLTATIILGGSQIDKSFDLIVLPEPSNAMGFLEEDVNTLELYPGNIINIDYLILPRVTDNGSYIEWITSDASVIDLDGNVTLPQPGAADKNVTLSAQIIRGAESLFKDFNLTVTYKAPSVEMITENDSRILNKVKVSTKIAFIQAIQSAKAGDAIILAPGNYSDINISLTTSGTEANPIFIMGAVDGTTNIQGESHINIKANHVVVANLSFNNGSPSTDRGVVWLEGNYLRLTNTIYDDYETIGNDYKWVSSTGQFHEIDRNTFTGKQTGGALLTIWRDDTGAQFHHIHHNVFKDYKNGGGVNGYETIRLGTSTHSQSDGYILVEDNLFEDVNGEIEIISVKAGRNVIRRNTFIRSLGHITLRHGKNNAVIANAFNGEFIAETGGIRFYDAGHIICENYIEAVNTTSNTRGGIVIHSGVNVPGEITTLNAQWTPYNVLVKNNTIYGSRQSILYDGKYSHGSKDVYLENNLIVAAAGFAAVRYDKNHGGLTFKGDHYYSDTAYAAGGTYLPSSIPAGVTFAKELLVLNSVDGVRLHQTYGATKVMMVDRDTVGVSWKRG